MPASRDDEDEDEGEIAVAMPPGRSRLRRHSQTLTRETMSND